MKLNIQEALIQANAIMLANGIPSVYVQRGDPTDMDTPCLMLLLSQPHITVMRPIKVTDVVANDWHYYRPVP